MQPHDQSQMRVSDEDRHKIAEVLREAAGQGRLDLDELDERLEATYAAKVYADLVPLTLDLPGPGGASPVPVPPHGGVPAYAAQAGMPAQLPRHEGSMAFMSGITRAGYWEVPVTHTATSIIGSVTIDLREARFTAPETVINANTIMGEITIYVNAGTHVVMDGSGIMGDFAQSKDKVPAQIGPGSPVVRVKGFALIGAVTVTRKKMPGEPGKLKKMLGG